MKFTNSTSIYKNKIDIKLICDLKESLFEYINTNANRGKYKNIEDFEKVVLNMFEDKLLGATLKNFCDSKEMIFFKERFQKIINDLFDINTETFPINVIRVFHPKIIINKLSWHQDEATWNHIDEYRRKFPFTFWIPILSSDFSTLEVEVKPRKKIYYHSYLDYQGRFNGKYNLENDSNIIICKNAREGDFVSFSSATFHKTWQDQKSSLFSNFKGSSLLRISVDLRFIIPNSEYIKKHTSYSKRLSLLNLKNKLIN